MGLQRVLGCEDMKHAWYDIGYYLAGFLQNLVVLL